MKLRMGASLQNGKYQLNQILGRESLGATYIATQTLLHQPVVIKTLDPSLQVTQSFPQLKTRFIEETRLLARCQHPSLVRILDFFQEDHLPFLVMDYIPGQTLHDRITSPNASPLTEAEAVHYMRQIASALSITHRTGLTHRNIRPETIIRRQGTNLGILVGFGLAYDVAPPDLIPPNPFTPPVGWTSATPFGIDLYSLAATLYYLLSGQTPNGNLVLEQHSWSPATKQAIFRGLTRDPQWQVQTIEEWLRLLPNTTLPLMSGNTPQNNRVPVVTGNTANGKPRPRTPNTTLPPIPAENLATPEPAIKLPTPTPPAKVPTAKPAPATAIPAPVQAIVKPVRHLPKLLMLAIVTAGAMGLGFGFALRISAAKTPGTSILHPVQPFSEKDWKGTIKPTPNTEAPTETPASSTKSTKAPAKYIDPEVDQPDYAPAPRTPIQEPEYTPPVQPRYPRSQAEPVIPAKPKPVKPAPDPIAPPPEPAAPVEPAPPAVTTPAPAAPPNIPAPVKPSVREIDPNPPIPRSKVGE